jgi:hypothetical protein
MQVGKCQSQSTLYLDYFMAQENQRFAIKFNILR